MLNAVFSLISALAIFLILTEVLTIKLHYGENYSIEFHFIVFALVLKNSPLKEKRQKNKKRNKQKNFHFFYSLVLILMRHSTVRINNFTVSLPKSKPMNDALNYGICSGLISSLLSFAENNSKFFEASNITLFHSEHNTLKKELDAELKLSLIDAFISYVKFLRLIARDRHFNKRMRTKNE